MSFLYTPTLERLDFLFHRITKDTAVLDVGCGGAGSCIPLEYQPVGKTIAARAGSYVGVEPDPKKAAPLAALGLVVMQKPIEVLTEADRFDVVIAGLVMMYTKDVNAALRAAHASLKHGGVIVCDVPNVWYASRILKYLASGRYGMMDDVHNNYVFDRASLAKLFQENGFVVTEERFIRGRIREKLYPRRFSEFIGIVAEKR